MTAMRITTELFSDCRHHSSKKLYLTLRYISGGQIETTYGWPHNTIRQATTTCARKNHPRWQHTCSQL